MKLSGAYVLYQHEEMFEGCITTTVFDTNLTYQSQIPPMKILTRAGMPYKSEKLCTVVMLNKLPQRAAGCLWA